MDTVEQTIEQLLVTVKELTWLAQRAVDNVSNPGNRYRLRDELENIIERHQAQD